MSRIDQGSSSAVPACIPSVFAQWFSSDLIEILPAASFPDRVVAPTLQITVPVSAPNVGTGPGTLTAKFTSATAEMSTGAPTPPAVPATLRPPIAPQPGPGVSTPGALVPGGTVGSVSPGALASGPVTASAPNTPGELARQAAAQDARPRRGNAKGLKRRPAPRRLPTSDGSPSSCEGDFSRRTGAGRS